MENTTMINSDAEMQNQMMRSLPSLSETVRRSLQQYFSQLGGQTPANIYDMVLPEFERPLFEEVLQFTNDNQSQSAKILGISRGTLRKKMAIYGLFKKK